MFSGNKEKIQEIKKEKYEWKYFKECKEVWEKYVPRNGQSEVLQGEMLRQIEKIRLEAQENGNRNWDEDFTYFCDFLKENLCMQPYFQEKEKDRFRVILDYLKECGEYATMVNQGKIPEKKVEIEKIAYVADNLYDILADGVGKIQKKHPEPIPNEILPNLKR